MHPEEGVPAISSLAVTQTHKPFPVPPCIRLPGLDVAAADGRTRAGCTPNKLFVDPMLPKWLANTTIVNLRVRPFKSGTRFLREGEQIHFNALARFPLA